jgi:hypothetical protein
MTSNHFEILHRLPAPAPASTDPLNASSSTLTVDYDLYVYDGTTRVARSTSFDNSYEIAEFTGQPGKTYSILIHKFSGNDWAYCGVAWTVHQ